MPQRAVRDASVNRGVIHCSWSDKWLRPGGGSSSCELIQSQFSAAVQQRQPVGDKRATTRPVATSVSPRLIVCSRRAGAALDTFASHWQVFVRFLGLASGDHHMMIKSSAFCQSPRYCSFSKSPSASDATYARSDSYAQF